jgi:hypothetical protein
MSSDERALTQADAVRIRNQMQLFGFLNCTTSKVLSVAAGKSINDAALESAILQELMGLPAND